MKELSLNILDIAMNSVKAKAENIGIFIEETDETLSVTISDDGCGMSEEMVKSVTDPFCTTRTTRKVGMGIPLLKLAAEQTNGEFSIKSSDKPDDHGTVTRAVFYKNHIDFTPLGDVISSVTTLIQGAPDIDWKFVHSKGNKSVELDTKELRAVLGDVSLSNYEVIKWIEDYLKEGYESI
ncbi:MAG: ATP-binding protein [Clostridia bacterium]|nr:ATP-binding protein [Clostridia bacterium]